jgi:hypothetical protein
MGSLIMSDTIDDVLLSAGWVPVGDRWVDPLRVEDPLDKATAERVQRGRVSYAFVLANAAAEQFQAMSRVVDAAIVLDAGDGVRVVREVGGGWRVVDVRMSLLDGRTFSSGNFALEVVRRGEAVPPSAWRPGPAWQALLVVPRERAIAAIAAVWWARKRQPSEPTWGTLDAHNRGLACAVVSRVIAGIDPHVEPCDVLAVEVARLLGLVEEAKDVSPVALGRDELGELQVARA